MAAFLADGLSDLAAALKRRRVWTALAAEDIGDAHRRTLLGPAWLLINYLCFVGVIVLIIRSAGGVQHYAAYVAIGLLVWLFIAETVTESISVFFREESLIKGTPLPVSLYVLRQAARSAMRSGYALPGAIGIVLFAGPALAGTALAALPGIALVLATAPAAALLLGTAGAIFPDLQYFVVNIMRLGLFLTPVFWSHENAGGLRAALYHWNPATHYLDIVRLPVVAGEVPWTSWGVCLALTALIWLSALAVLGRYRRRIVFMV